MGTLTFDIFSLRDSVLESGISIFLTLYVVYLVTMRVLQFQYKLRFNTRAPELRMFRIYDSRAVEYIPYQCERHFYKTTNRVTLAFNTIIITAVVIYVASAIL